MLLGKRLAKSFIGHYQTPGGMMEPNELAEWAAVRESKEELGTDVHVIVECDHTMTYTPTFSYANRGPITVWYMIAVLAGRIDVPENEKPKCDDWTFYDRDKLPSPLTFITAYGLHVLDYYIAQDPKLQAMFRP